MVNQVIIGHREVSGSTNQPTLEQLKAATIEDVVHQARWNQVDTQKGYASKHDCELTPNVHLHFTGHPPVKTGVPDDGEPALMSRLINLTIRKRLGK